MGSSGSRNGKESVVGSPIFSLQSNSFIVGQGHSTINSQWQTLFVLCPKLIEASIISSKNSIEFGQSFQQGKRNRSPLPTSSTFSAMLLLVEQQSATCHQYAPFLRCKGVQTPLKISITHNIMMDLHRGIHLEDILTVEDATISSKMEGGTNVTILARQKRK